MAAEGPPYNLMPKGLDDSSFFINGSESWKVSSLFLELEDFTFVLSIEVLKSHVLALLLDGHVQEVKSEKVFSLLFELKSFTFVLAIDMLKGFILALLWKAIRRDRKDGKT